MHFNLLDGSTCDTNPPLMLLIPKGVSMKKNLMFVFIAVFFAAVGFGVETSPEKSSTTRKKVPAKSKTEAKLNKEKAAEKAPSAPTVAPVGEPDIALPSTTLTPPTGTLTTPPTGAVTSPTTTTETVVVAAPSEAGLQGELDTRPSWTSGRGEFHTETGVELGYKFNKDVLVNYHQDFNTNIYEPLGDTKGLDLRAKEGFLRGKINNVWMDGPWHFNYEARAYLPTRLETRDAGMITAVQNYLKLKYDIADKTSITLVEVPIVHFYDRAGTTVAGVSKANPIFENRVYLIGNVEIVQNLNLELPIMFHQKRHRDFVAGADNNNAWSYYLWVYPELAYDVTPNVSLGVAYYNYDSFLTANLSDTQFKTAFDSGVTQLVLRATL